MSVEEVFRQLTNKINFTEIPIEKRTVYFDQISAKISKSLRKLTTPDSFDGYFKKLNVVIGEKTQTVK